MQAFLHIYVARFTGIKSRRPQRLTESLSTYRIFAIELSDLPTMFPVPCYSAGTSDKADS